MISHQNIPRKSIFLVGPHSSGKTTLANALHLKFSGKIPLLQETARKVLQDKKYSRDDIRSSKCFEMQRDILQAQFQAENQVFQEQHFGSGGISSPVMISDRAGVDPILYTLKYSPCPDDWIRLCSTEEWKILRERYRDSKNSLVVLVKPVKEFLVDDGTRMIPLDWQDWKEFGDNFQWFLEHEEIPYKIIGENCLPLEERVGKILKWVN